MVGLVVAHTGYEQRNFYLAKTVPSCTGVQVSCEFLKHSIMNYPLVILRSAADNTAFISLSERSSVVSPAALGSLLLITPLPL